MTVHVKLQTLSCAGTEGSRKSPGRHKRVEGVPQAQEMAQGCPNTSASRSAALALGRRASRGRTACSSRDSHCITIASHMHCTELLKLCQAVAEFECNAESIHKVGPANTARTMPICPFSRLQPHRCSARGSSACSCFTPCLSSAAPGSGAPPAFPAGDLMTKVQVQIPCFGSRTEGMHNLWAQAAFPAHNSCLLIC